MKPHHHPADYWLVPLAFLACFTLFYFQARPLLDDSDVPWHLATGALIWKTHQLPVTDPWSFASGGTPWYNLSWIWDLMIGAAERVGNLFGVFVFTCTFAATCIAFLTSRLLWMGIHRSAIILTIAAVALCMLDFIVARPQLMGYAMILLFHALLHEGRTHWRCGRMLSMPLLMMLWANSHGSFLVGFVIFAALGIEALVNRNFWWLAGLIAVGIACAGAALVNPYGPEVMLGAMRTLGGEAQKYTLEWLPFTFSSSLGISTWILLFIIGSNFRVGRAKLGDKLLSIFWLVATLFIMRNAAVFILLSAPYLAICFDRQTRGLRVNRPPSWFARFVSRQSPTRLWALTTLIFCWGVYTAYHMPHQDRIQTPELSAADAVDYALKNYPERRYLTDFNFGGEVIYLAGGKINMFMDSRAGTAYSESTMQDYLTFAWQVPGWESVLAPYKIDGLIISKGMAFARDYENGLHRDKWKLVFAGKRANVYIATPGTGETSETPKTLPRKKDVKPR